MKDQKMRDDFADKLDAHVLALSSLSNFIRRAEFKNISRESISLLAHDIRDHLDYVFLQIPEKKQTQKGDLNA